MTRLLVRGDNEEDTFSLEDLKSVSTLHVLVITDAPLKIVQYVHEDNPDALTQDVFLDACNHSHSLDILRYLKEQVPPEYYTPDKIAPIMCDILNNGKEEVYVVQVQILSTLFSEAMIYYVSENNSPLDEVLFVDSDCDGRDFQADLLDHMVECIPSTIKSFSLPSTSENENVEYIYKTLATALAKSNIETFYWAESSWSADFVDFFSTLLPGAWNLRTLEISVPGKDSAADQGLFASFPTAWLQTSQISTLSLRLGDDDSDPEYADFSMLPWLAQMTQLETVRLEIVRGSADEDFCKALCQVLALGRLKSLIVDASDYIPGGLFHSLLGAVASCQSLSKFHLIRIGRMSSHTGAYLDRMVTIMKTNASLKDAWISTITTRTNGYGRVPKVPKENQKQSVIDYFTTLNSCGRGLARDSDNASDLVKVLMEAALNMEARPRSDIPRTNRVTVAQALYGLLLESPGTWSANALGHDLIHLNCHSRGVKRKASSLPRKTPR